MTHPEPLPQPSSRGDQSETGLSIDLDEFPVALTTGVETMGVWRHDLETGIIIWSADLFRIFGLDPAAGVPRLSKQRELFPAEDYRRFDEAIARIKQDGRPYTLELSILACNQAPRRIVAKGYARRNEAGDISRLYGCVIDITAISDLQTRLSDRENQLRLAQESSRAGLWSYDVAGDSWRISGELSRVLGIAEASYTLEQALALVPTDDRQTVRQQIAYHLARVQPMQIEHRFVNHTTGETGWLSVRGEVICDEQGNVVQAVGMSRDITELKISQQIQQETEQRLTMAQEASQTSWFEYDPQSKLLTTTHVGQHILGLPHTSLKIESLLSFFSQNQRKMILRLFDDWPADDDSFEFEQSYQHPDTGDTVWLNIRGGKREKPGSRGWMICGTFTDITARKQAQLEVQASRDMLAEAERLARAFAWELDLRSDTWRLSPNWLSMLNLPDDTSPSETLLMDMVHPEDRHFVRRSLDDAIIRRKSFNLEIRTMIEGDKVRHMHLIGEPVIDDSDEVIKLIGAVHDITDLSKAQTALSKSEARFRQFMNSVPAFVYIKNDNHIFRYGNRALRERGSESLFDFDNLEGKHTRDIYPPELATQIDALEDEILATGMSVPQEMAIPMKDGTMVWVSGVKFPIYLDTERYIGGFYVDVTERRLADQEKERFQSAIEQSGEMIMITDVDGTIRYINPVVEDMTGYKMQEMIGKKPIAFRNGQYDQSIYDEIRRTIQGGGTWRGNLENRRKDGSHIVMKATISPVRDESNEITGFVCVSRDITRQREMEQMLQQSQKLESIGTLAGGVAHDYNNVLQTILGNAELLVNDDSITPDAAVLVQEIRSAAEQSARLTSQLLTFARKQNIEPTTINMNDQIGTVASMLQRLIGTNITLGWSPGRDLWNIRIDVAQWHQIVTNLCINARDAIHSVGNIVLSTTNLVLSSDNAEGLPPGDYVCLEVSDDGSGMDEDVAKRVFEPFFTTKPLDRGTGLGLSTVYGIVKQNQGHIELQSEIGKGTTFRVLLPRDPNNSVSTFTAEIADIKQCEQGATVLVVEDDPAILKLIERTLDRLGYSVIRSDDPREALQSLQTTSRIDLLITDIVMPSMNGKELASRVRSLHPRTGVIFMSGFTADVLNDANENHVPHLFLQKPFTMKALTEKIAEALKRDVESA